VRQRISLTVTRLSFAAISVTMTPKNTLTFSTSDKYLCTVTPAFVHKGAICLSVHANRHMQPNIHDVPRLHYAEGDCNVSPHQQAAGVPSGARARVPGKTRQGVLSLSPESCETMGVQSWATSGRRVRAPARGTKASTKPLLSGRMRYPATDSRLIKSFFHDMSDRHNGPDRDLDCQ
jgi:hypothetical protein